MHVELQRVYFELMVIMMKGGMLCYVFKRGLLRLAVRLPHRYLVIQCSGYELVRYYGSVDRNGDLTKTNGSGWNFGLITLLGTLRGLLCHLQLITNQLMF